LDVFIVHKVLGFPLPVHFIPVHVLQSLRKSFFSVSIRKHVHRHGPREDAHQRHALYARTDL